MCGFVGFTFPISQDNAKKSIKKMMSPIEHRGPDENSIHISSEIALGHFRLSIIDLNGGQQPCHDDNNNDYLVFNGEIYGYKNHARLLEKHGIKLKDQSDSEVLFQSLKSFGVEKTLNMIDGMFAFAFYEGKTKSLWLARDRMGEKPLYYSHKNNRTYLITLILIVLFDVIIIGFYFGSEKLLQRFLFMQDEINEYIPSVSTLNLTRGNLTQFAFAEFKNFIFFGYGGGGFESLLKINFLNLSTQYASHAHSDLIEFMGEFGIVGSILISLSILSSCLNRNFLSFKNFMLGYLLIFILIFDFSFHIPIIQLLFILLLSINYKRSNNSEHRFKD